MLSRTALLTLADRVDEALPVDALWLFGSEAAGRANAQSDIDLAALFRHPPSPRALVELRLDLAARMNRAIDLVDLGSASPILVMQVLRKGQLILDKNAARRCRFVAAAPARYEDLLRVRRPVERALRERLVRG